MLMYQLQDRVLNLDSGTTLTFPNQIKIEVHLGPPEVFGRSNAPSRLLIPGREATVTFHGNTGRVTFCSTPSLEPLNVTIRWPSARMQLTGDVVCYERSCENLENLIDSMHALQYLLPVLLNLEFPEPPFVISVSGRVGENDFRWIHRQVNFPFIPQNAESLEGATLKTVERMMVVQETRYRRLMAALHYLHVASRLLAAGQSQWEFMPECVLNLCKSLEIVFGTSRDNIRGGLAELGYSPDEIEGDFIPIVLLRNHFDVGHPRLAVLRGEQLSVLYNYLANAESKFKRLFIRICDRVIEDSFPVTEPGEMELGTWEQRQFDRLVDSMRARHATDGTP